MVLGFGKQFKRYIHNIYLNLSFLILSFQPVPGKDVHGVPKGVGPGARAVQAQTAAMSVSSELTRGSAEDFFLLGLLFVSE